MRKAAGVDRRVDERGTEAQQDSCRRHREPSRRQEKVLKQRGELETRARHLDGFQETKAPRRRWHEYGRDDGWEFRVWGSGTEEAFTRAATGWGRRGRGVAPGVDTVAADP